MTAWSLEAKLLLISTLFCFVDFFLEQVILPTVPATSLLKITNITSHHHLELIKNIWTHWCWSNNSPEQRHQQQVHWRVNTSVRLSQNTSNNNNSSSLLVTNNSSNNNILGTSCADLFIEYLFKIIFSCQWNLVSSSIPSAKYSRNFYCIFLENKVNTVRNVFVEKEVSYCCWWWDARLGVGGVVGED